MNFSRRRTGDDEPEINLIPLIDVLLVILIFLAATTTFLRQTALQVALPEVNALPQAAPTMLELAISHEGRYALNGTLLDAASTRALSDSIRDAAAAHPDAVLLIQADAQTAHHHVVSAMEAARQAGLARVNFAVRSTP